ncbi:unnamed protein product [Diatraea saccharalis]|uniref:BHLH domain-containing protein n=1 Tax=Diatraea saccharalis TaxID=40085 RepID=A0A9N9RBX1_9NEOP|nr:unnamed protein product [Diatraea saccharalis]
MMSPDFNEESLSYELWDPMEQEHWEVSQTSEFWTQINEEAGAFELAPPENFLASVPETEEDWRIMEEIDELHPPVEDIVHHDCMWAGDILYPSNTFVQNDYSAVPTIPGQSLLRRDNNMSPPRPETPSSLDGDEPPQFRHAVDVAGTALRLLRDSAAVAADHSYTLARQQFDNLGVQTPSDSCESEEEIDVVSVGTSQQMFASPHVRTDALPRVPSAQERQHIQRTVASAIDPCSPQPVARKRLTPPTNVSSSGHRRRARGPGRRGRRSNTDTESEGEAPDIERRSIHNDMERLRRIGLKNLFDELKKQIPATRDKERAPKVVILREAAALCRKMRDEDSQREVLKKQQAKLITKLKKLRTMLSTRYRSY